MYRNIEELMKVFVKYILPVILLTFCWNSTNAQSKKILEITSIKRGDIKYGGFKLESGKSIHIEAIGAGLDEMPQRIRNFQVDPSGMFAYAWIINAQNRQFVWQMNAENTDKVSRRGYNRKFDDDIRLPAGEYEAYFSAQEPYNIKYDDGFFSLGRLLDKLLRGKDDYESHEEDWELVIEGVDDLSSSSLIDKFHQARKAQSVLTITDVHNSDFQQQGFTLTEKGLFNIYAIGEAFEGEEFDYGWIVRADNSKKVWEMIDENSDHAGGAIKNRVWRKEIELVPGDYWVYYVTDDSHSPEKWNANPPYDPDFYGITINGVPNRFDPKSIKELIKLKVNPIIQINKVGNDELIQEGFETDDELKIRVHALGEGRDGEMFDYGWITNVKTGEKVWEMDYNKTRNGGGADKNRLVDEIITLPAGSYMVYYMTDGSHAYRSWNTSPPYEPSNWGITIYPADARYSEKKIRKFTEIEKAANIVAQAIMVRDDQHIRKKFKLEKETKVRIYAIGEGGWDEMYDYGWIENLDENEIVWEMTYDKTHWAGGAQKNRKVDTVITLEPGRYELNYKTDGSHSFNDWNDNPPEDPINWGMTIYDLSKKKE